MENSATPQQQPGAAAKPSKVNGHANSGEVKSASAQVASLKAKAAARGIGRKASTTVNNVKIAARRPKSFEWVRVHPDPENFSIILPAVVFGKEEADDDKKAAMQKADIYVIHPRMLPHEVLSAACDCEVELVLLGCVFD